MGPAGAGWAAIVAVAVFFSAPFGTVISAPPSTATVPPAAPIAAVAGSGLGVGLGDAVWTGEGLGLLGSNAAGDSAADGGGLDAEVRAWARIRVAAGDDQDRREQEREGAAPDALPAHRSTTIASRLVLGWPALPRLTMRSVCRPDADHVFAEHDPPPLARARP